MINSKNCKYFFKETHFKSVAFLFCMMLFFSAAEAQRTPAIGSAQAFNTATTANVTTGRLDNDHVLIVYKNGSTSAASDLYAVVGEIDTTAKSISYGTPQLIEPANMLFPGLLIMSPTEAVVFYESTVISPNPGYSRVLSIDVSSDAITSVGSVQQFQSGDIDAAYSHNTFSSVQLTSNTFALAYSNNDNSDYGTVNIGTISGSTISYGSDQIFSSSDVQNIWMSSLASDKIVISYEDDSDSDYGKAIVGTVSGNTITFGSPITFNSAATSWTAVQGLSSTQFAVAYINDDSNDYGYAKVGTVGGTSIIFSSAAYDFETAQDARDITIDALQGNEFVIGYNGGFGDNTRIIVGEATGTNSSAAISFSTAQTILADEGDDSWVKRINDNTIVMGYTNESDANDYGEVVVGTLAGLVLPIELLDFEVHPIANNRVALNWTTASEINNAYFTIERSADARNWGPINKITGAGNTYQLSSYSAIDVTPLPGLSYYRLKQTDFNGKFSYSGIESIRLNNIDHKISVHPNPVTDYLQIVSEQEMDATAELYDSSGRLILQVPFEAEGSLDFRSLNKGIYILKVFSSGGTPEYIQVIKE